MLMKLNTADSVTVDAKFLLWVVSVDLSVSLSPQTPRCLR